VEVIHLHEETNTTDHLQLFNDTMLLGIQTVCKVEEFNNILYKLIDSSRTPINQDKFQILFLNIPPTIQTKISIIIGFQKSTLPFEYLGAPLVENSVKQVSWEDLLDRMKNKLDI